MCVVHQEAILVSVCSLKQKIQQWLREETDDQTTCVGYKIFTVNIKGIPNRDNSCADLPWGRG